MCMKQTYSYIFLKLIKYSGYACLRSKTTNMEGVETLSTKLWKPSGGTERLRDPWEYFPTSTDARNILHVPDELGLE